ncbi:hypothetical protein RU12_22845 [Salmonella enterica]|nr:hypothetical protein [Salmonella enterica]EAY5894561.1 hypothetical protein [Salmonella enterica]
MNFKSIWNIWFPQEEAFSITTFYTSEKASQKLNLAIRQSCGMSGGATEREVFIRHTPPAALNNKLITFMAAGTMKPIAFYCQVNSPHQQ